MSVENSMGIVHSSKGVLEPASDQLMSEPKIIAELARTTLETSDLDWDDLVSDYDHIRELIEKSIPGFDDYNNRVRVDGGFYLPNGAREGNFNTIEGRAHFTINKLPEYQIGSARARHRRCPRRGG